MRFAFARRRSPWETDDVRLCDVVETLQTDDWRYVLHPATYNACRCDVVDFMRALPSKTRVSNWADRPVGRGDGVRDRPMESTCVSPLYAVPVYSRVLIWSFRVSAVSVGKSRGNSRYKKSAPVSGRFPPYLSSSIPELCRAPSCGRACTLFDPPVLRCRLATGYPNGAGNEFSSAMPQWRMDQQNSDKRFFSFFLLLRDQRK